MKKLSIANRIQLSFIAAIGMVLVIGFLSFYYINRLNRGLETIVEQDIRLARLTEEIKSLTFDVSRLERLYLQEPTDPKRLERLKTIVQSLTTTTKQAQGLSHKDINRQRYTQMTELSSEYQSILPQDENIPNDPMVYGRLREILRDIAKLNGEVLLDRYKELEIHQEDVSRLSSDAQRNMMIVVLLMLLSGLGLGFVAPNVVGAPFRKMVQAINEVRTGKLNVSIPVEANDEIGRIGKSLNSMITELREFDEMKIKRIAFEKRRFEILANMVDYGVIVLKREGVIEFINSQLYILLRCDTKEIEGYRVEHTPLPPEIKELLTQCLETKEKIDNLDLSIHAKDKNGQDVTVDLIVDTAMVRTHDGTIVNIIITFEEKSTHVDKVYLARTMSKKEENASSI